MSNDTLKQIADNLGVGLINGSYLSGIANYYGVDLATSDDLMADILLAVGGNPINSTDYLQDIVLELGGTVTINGNWMEAWEAITAIPPAPVNTIAPVISGSTSVGSVLTTTNGTWTNSPVSFAYQWKRGATNIGTNASTYTLVVADTNQAITCVVTATNAGGSTPATSNIITADNPFISTFRTTASSETVTLPYEVAGTYSGTINWGDSSTSTNSYANRIHTYAVAGDYVITVTGVTTGFRFNNTGDRTKIRSIQNWGTLRLGNSANYFQGCTNLTLTAVNGVLDLTGTTNFGTMFGACSSLTTINNINSWNTSAVTAMNSMFSFASAFNQALSFNTGAVTSMASMFSSATNFNQALTFNTSAVTTMNSMFAGATAFNQPLSFNTGAVTTMQGMFFNATAFNSTLTFTSTSLVTTMNSMFANATAFNQPLSFNTAAVTNMLSMFQGATAFNQNISSWNTSAVLNMQSMFQSATAFNQNISSWNTGAVTLMRGMFQSATAFNQNLGSWNVANVINFTDFMLGKTPATFSTTNLDAIYNGWVTVQSSRIISFGTAKYSAAGVAGRAFLTGTKLWTITDGGL